MGLLKQMKHMKTVVAAAPGVIQARPHSIGGNKTNKRVFGGLAAAVMLAGGLAFTSAGTVAAAAVNDGKICEGLSSTKIDTPGEPQSITILPADYPAGNVITGYCVKAGSENQVGGGPVYVVLPPGTTTVTFGHPSTKAVSHYSFSYAPVVPPTPTPETPVVPPTPETPVPPTPQTPVTPTPETPVSPTPQTPVPPTPQTPVTPTETPASPTPDVVVAALPPVQAAPAQAVAPAAALPAQALPSTGIDGTGITAIIALLLTSLGGAALFVSRRFNVTN